MLVIYNHHYVGRVNSISAHHIWSMIHVFLYDSIYAYKLMDLRVIFLVVPKWG